MNVREWIAQAGQRLCQEGFESWHIEAQLLAAHTLGKTRSEIIAHPEWTLDEGAAQTYVERRLRHEPLAYILGRREFYGRDFIVTPDVLIPRHETETLIDAARELTPPNANVLDLGTGSGCIAITLKLERPDLTLTAIDMSPASLDVARKNAERLSADIDFKISDGFCQLVEQSFDVIVSNPPYVGHNETLPREVVEYEPHAALYADNDGLAFYERIAKESKGHVPPNGLVILEFGHTQAAAVIKIFTDQAWHFVRMFHDLSGIERAAAFQRP